jgi:hypothetical protein
MGNSTVSEAHLHRYLAEADFKWDTREALGYDDVERVAPSKARRRTRFFSG